MPNELKIIIDADVSRAIAGVQSVSKAIASDFVGATKSASTAAGDLQKIISQFQASVNSLSTSGITSEIDKLNSKLSSLKDIDITANPQEALIAIDSVIDTINKLKSANILVDADTSPALADITELQTKLKGVKTSILLTADDSLVNAEINKLQTRLASLQAKIPLVVSATGLEKLNSEIAETKSQLNSLKNKKVSINLDIKGGANTLSNLDRQLVQTSANAQKFGASIQKEATVASAALSKIPNTSGAATQSLINLSRVAQDAPFGFIGIANNLNPLLESFQRLQAESRATGTSLTKNLFGALLGPAGIGLAIGVVSSLLISFGDDFKRIIAGSEDFSDAIDKAGDSVLGNASKVTILVKALQSDTLTTQEAKKAKKELIDLAPEFQNSFDGNKISIERSEVALKKYIDNLVKTVKVTAALGIVNDKLKESIAQVAKGGETSFFQKISSFFESGGNSIGSASLDVLKGADNLQKASDKLTSANISKLIQETFKSLGISFEDAVDVIDDGTKKVGKSLDQLKDEVISKARLAAKAFETAFVVPELEITFFKNKDEVFKEAKDFLSNVNAFLKGDIGKLKIKLRPEFETKTVVDEILRDVDGIIKEVKSHKITIPLITELDFLPVSEGISQDVIDGFFKTIGTVDLKLPVEVTPDLTISKASIDAINKKLDLRKQFEVLGKGGLEEFNKIFKDIDSNNFSNLQDGIEQATKKLQGMMAIAQTLNQAIGQGLTNAFNSVFDAILEGKSVFKALGEGIKQLVIGTIKAIAQMLILKAVSSFIFPGGAGFAGGIGGGLRNAAGLLGGNANFGGLSGIGSRAFQNVLTVNVVGNISGDTIRLTGQRAANSQGRFGG